jgi:hypothetical protein
MPKPEYLVPLKPTKTAMTHCVDKPAEISSRYPRRLAPAESDENRPTAREELSLIQRDLESVCLNAAQTETLYFASLRLFSLVSLNKDRVRGEDFDSKCVHGLMPDPAP